MQSAIDSFVTYLSTELADDPGVYWMRVTPDRADSGDLQLNKLNVSALQWQERGASEDILVSLDIVGDNERTVVGWAKKVRDKLAERQYTNEADHEANVASPVALDRCVYWLGNEIAFDQVARRPHWVQMNATFSISHSKY